MTRTRLVPALLGLSFLVAAAWWYTLDLIARLAGKWYRKTRPRVDLTVA